MPAPPSWAVGPATLHVPEATPAPAEVASTRTEHAESTEPDREPEESVAASRRDRQQSKAVAKRQQQETREAARLAKAEAREAAAEEKRAQREIAKARETVAREAKARAREDAAAERALLAEEERENRAESKRRAKDAKVYAKQLAAHAKQEARAAKRQAKRPPAPIEPPASQAENRGPAVEPDGAEESTAAAAVTTGVTDEIDEHRHEPAPSVPDAGTTGGTDEIDEHRHEPAPSVPAAANVSVQEPSAFVPDEPQIEVRTDDDQPASKGEDTRVSEPLKVDDPADPGDDRKSRIAGVRTVAYAVAGVIGVLGLLCSIILAVGTLLVALGAGEGNALYDPVSSLSKILIGPLDGAFDFSGVNAAKREQFLAWGVGCLIYLVVSVVGLQLSQRAAGND